MSQPGARSLSSLIWPLLIVTAATLVAITSGSFWIDEFSTEMFANTPTLRECWAFMQRIRYPEIQAPFYMAYIWAWTNLFGSDEWVMRLAGAPWFITGALVFTAYVGRLLRATFLVALLVAFSPFAWYYLNEARVYAFQLGFALAAFGAATELGRTAPGSEPNQLAQRIFIIALVGLCGSSVLGAVFGFTLFVGLLATIHPRRWHAMVRATPVASLIGVAILLGLAAYYAWTKTVQPRATNVGTTTPQTVIFVFYELLGFIGLGPGRNTLRSEGAAALKPYLPTLVLFATTAVVTLYFGVREIATRLGRHRFAWLATLSLVPLLLLIGIGVSTHFRLLGRHVTPALPLVLFVVSFGVVRACQGRPWQKMAAAVFFLLWLSSSFSIRWAERQRKDEYRDAARIARAALEAGAVVWWSADIPGAKYYGLPATTNTLARFQSLMNADAELLRTLPRPDVIVVSKPDTFDTSRGVTSYIQQQQLMPAERLPSFVVYRRPPPP